MESFWICFATLFVAVDAFGALPIFISITGGLEERTIRRVIVQSMATAAIVAFAFILVGNAFIGLIGITVSDFMIAGGTLLFIISISNIIMAEQVRVPADVDTVGAVPIGVPLVVGPAVLATLVLLVQRYGFWSTSIALLLNILLAGVIFLSSKPVNRMLGKAGSKTLSKVASLLMAAFAVMLIRQGISQLIPAITS